MQRMVTRVSGPPPYEWLLGAIEKFAAKAESTRAAACCLLLDRGLSRNLASVRVLKPFAVSRGQKAQGESSEETIIPAFSLSGKYTALPEAIDEALGTLREQHIERARVAVQKLVERGLAKEPSVVRGWRLNVEQDGEETEGLLMQFAGDRKLPEGALVDACDCVTDEMTAADVMRAIWATELDREGLAPDGWNKRHAVGTAIKWLQLTTEVR